MLESHKQRDIDLWLKWAAVLGPLAGVLVGAFLRFQSDHDKVGELWGFKAKQETFDVSVVESIARLQEITKRIK